MRKKPFTIEMSDESGRWFITWWDPEFRNDTVSYRTKADAKSDAEQQFRRRLKEAREFLARWPHA
jgi:hypothetical protein